jgi:hypothetical protein
MEFRVYFSKKYYKILQNIIIALGFIEKKTYFEENLKKKEMKNRIFSTYF